MVIQTVSGQEMSSRPCKLFFVLFKKKAIEVVKGQKKIYFSLQLAFRKKKKSKLSSKKLIKVELLIDFNNGHNKGFLNNNK